MEEFFELKGHIGNVEKVQETSLDTGIYIAMCVCTITVLHEQYIDVSWNAETLCNPVTI